MNKGFLIIGLMAAAVFFYFLVSGKLSIFDKPIPLPEVITDTVK